MNSAPSNNDSTELETKRKEFTMKLMKKLSIRLSIIQAYKEILMKKLIEARRQAIEKIKRFIQSNLSLIKTVLDYLIRKKIRTYLLTSQIITKRREASDKIKSNIQIYITKKKFKEIHSKVKDCYSIYPSSERMNNVDIMIYTDPSNVRKGRCVPLKFCPLRKKFVFDVYKNKYRFNKIIRFNFVIEHTEIIDPAFVSKKIDGKYVNEINFSEFDRKIEYLKNSIYNIKTYTPKYNDYFLFENLKRKSSDEETLKTSCNSISDEDEYGNLRCGKENVSKSSTNLLSIEKEAKTFVNERKMIKPRKRFTTDAGLDQILKPILKNKLSSSGRKINQRRVSFGTVQFSF